MSPEAETLALSLRHALEQVVLEGAGKSEALRRVLEIVEAVRGLCREQRRDALLPALSEIEQRLREDVEKVTAVAFTIEVPEGWVPPSQLPPALVDYAPAHLHYLQVSKKT